MHYLKECEERWNAMRRRLPGKPPLKENTVPNAIQPTGARRVDKRSLKRIGQDEILALKHEALLGKANVLFAKLESEKAVKIQRAYRKFKARRKATERKSAVKVTQIA